MTTTTTNNVPGMIHLFEAKGLGKAPFKVVRVTSECGNCEYCNTAIVYRFYLKGADNKIFFVGSDCVHKTGDVGLIHVVEAEVKKRQAEMRKMRDDAKLEEYKTLMADPVVIEKMKNLPHPTRWYASQGRTLHDYAVFAMRYAGKAAKIKFLKTLKTL